MTTLPSSYFDDIPSWDSIPNLDAALGNTVLGAPAVFNRFDGIAAELDLPNDHLSFSGSKVSAAKLEESSGAIY